MKTYMFLVCLLSTIVLNMYGSKKCFVDRCYTVNVQYNFHVSVVVFEVIKSGYLVCCVMS
jgi:hypothetical protein